MHHKHLGDLAAHRHGRVERGRRILHDIAGEPTLKPLWQLVALKCQHLVLEGQCALRDCICLSVQQAQYRLSGQALRRSRFPNQRRRRTWIKIEAHPVDQRQSASVDRKIAYGQQWATDRARTSECARVHRSSAFLCNLRTVKLGIATLTCRRIRSARARTARAFSGIFRQPLAFERVSA